MKKPNRASSWSALIGLALLALLLGAGLSALTPRPGQTALYTLKNEPVFWTGWLGFSLLLLVGLGVLVLTVRWAQGGRGLLLAVGLALVLRLGLGIYLGAALPVVSAGNIEERSGYLFFDAYARDTRAWDLAHFNQPILSAFTADFVADQYGGLASLSALTYRFLSPDAHRPLMVIFLAALAGALALPLAYRAFRLRWSERVAILAVWILALYPESVLLGSQAMREPFLLALIALAFWAVLSLGQARWPVWFALAVSGVGLFLFSSRVAVVVVAFLAVWVWIEHSPRWFNPTFRRLGWVAILLGGLAGLLVFGAWLSETANWDAEQAVTNSGMLQRIFYRLGDGWELWVLPFMTVYGLATPVLPAAITDPAVWLRQVISIFRALGWYSLAPLLIYALWVVWKIKDRPQRRLMVWTILFALVWIVLSSYRAGGDIWDNPRYRTIWLVWLALIAAWAWEWSRLERDAWLVRWLAVEGIFLAAFTLWYANRKFGLGLVISFWTLVGTIVGLSLLVLVGGWLADRRRLAAQAAESPGGESHR